MARTAARSPLLSPVQQIELDVGEPDPRARYAIRVHVDTSGSGMVEAGDYVTTRSYLVMTYGQQNTVSVDLSRI